LDINALDIQSDDSSEVSIDDPEFFNDPETMKKKNKKNERDLRWKFSSKEIEKRDQEFLDEEKKIEKEQEYSSSKNKQQINLLIVEFIKKTLPLPKQHAMILDHTDLLTTKTFMKYNPQMRIDIINLETDNAVKIFHNLADLYPYKMHNLNNQLVFENLHVYSNRSYDDQLLQTCITEYSPNIYFADYTNTSMNHLTASRKINQKNNFRNVFGRVLKCTTEKKLVFAFTFSQRNASIKINKLTIIFIKLANKNKFLVNDFKTLSYRKSKHNGPMSFYIFQLLRDVPNYIQQNQKLLEEICKNSNYKSETWEHNKFD